MSREILLLVDVLAREKNVPREIVFGALELALASASKKRIHDEADVRVVVDRNTGDFETFRRWIVVPDEEYLSEEMQIPLSEAQQQDPEVEIGDFLEEELEPIDFGRIGAQAAKQVILQKIRDAERDQILNDFLERKEHLVTGTIKRMERGNAIIEAGKIEALLPREHMIPRENLKDDATIDSLGLKSIDLVMILTAIEEKFDVYIPMDGSFQDVKDLKGLVEAIGEHIVKEKAAK